MKTIREVNLERLRQDVSAARLRHQLDDKIVAATHEADLRIAQLRDPKSKQRIPWVWLDLLPAKQRKDVQTRIER